ncbi:phosphatase PAP2 family protein [Baekduia soli]|nr:phosphatase PAP2 family protein [Baekduia soli]
MSPRALRARPGPGLRRHSGARELLVFGLAYLTYFGVRAITEGDAARAFRNADGLIGLERRLGLDREAAVQGLVTGSRLLTDGADAVYIYGHWPVLVVSGVLLFRLAPAQYRTLRDACLISGLAGLVIFACFPVAPPRLSDASVIDTITRGSPGYRQLLPPSLVNQYAAMPSFHAGWNLLVGIAVYRATRHWALRSFAVLMPAAMAFAVVATANHFIIDVVVGVAIVLAALRAAVVLERRRARPTLISIPKGPNADKYLDIHTSHAVPRRAPRRQRPRAPAPR